MRSDELSDLGGRLARSLLAASVVGLGGALIDTAWARSAAEEAAPPALSLALADAGLVAPFALLFGLMVAGGLVFLAPRHPPSPRSLLAALRISAIGRPADVAAFAPLAVLAAFVWTTASAQVARALLSVEMPAALAGTAIAVSTVVLGVLGVLVALTLTPPLRHTLATASERWAPWVDPAVTGAGALLVVGALFAHGVQSGTVSGEGGFLGIWGIFKRPELDLRSSAVALVLLGAVAFAPVALPRISGVLALVLALLPLGLTARSAFVLSETPELTAAIERGAPLGKPTLALLRGLSDRDGDGNAGLFGGGDCDDTRADVRPEGREIPGNGVDEDCSGSDLSAEALAAATRPAASSSAAPASAPAAAPAGALPKGLNIVLITIDTLRADLGFLGYDRAVSPNLDALAKKSVVFERAYSLASYTGKSVGPMLIGKYGAETDRNWGHFNKFGDKDTFLAKRLKRAGLHTMSVQGHRYFGAFGGLDRGFDVVSLDAAPPESAAWDVDNIATSAKITDAALALLDKPESTSGPFHLWVHYLDPHADYLPHDDVPSFGKGQRDLYDGEVAFTDKHVGRLLDAIEKAPWGARTAIVVTSDHGEAFGEHGMYRHGFEVWEPLVRVPLLVYVPGLKPSRVAARRSHIDLVPTLLELAGAPVPPAPSATEGTDFVSGESLVPDLLRPSGEPAPPRDVLVDMPAGPYNDGRRALIRGDMKLITANNVRFEVYDLAADPEEKKNLVKEPAGEAMKATYDAWKTRLREIVVTGKKKQ